MKNKFLIIICSFIMLFALPIGALAEEAVTASNSSTTTDTYEENSFVVAADNDVSYNKSVDGSAVVAGNSVNFTGKTNGVLVEAGNNVTNTGSSEYALIAGNTVNLSGVYEKDSLILGDVINVNNSAEFGRDTFIFGSTVTLSGIYDRNVVIYADSITLDNVTITGDAKLIANKIVIKDSTNISGNVTYSTNDKNEISSAAKMGPVTLVTNQTRSYGDELLTSVYSYACVLFLFAVLALAIPKIFNRTAKEEFGAMPIFTLFGYGLLVLILVPILSLVLFSLYISIPFALILLGLYIMALYLSNIFTGYYVGKHLWTKIFKKDDNMLLEGLVGISFLFILSLIPYLGVVTAIISFLCGLGLIYNTCKSALKK